MSTLIVRISDLATRMATECKSLRTLLNANSADLSALTTTQKASLVAAINELKTALDALGTPITITTELGYRLRFDAVQTLTTEQKTQACVNLGVGEPDTDFVTTFNSGLI